VFPFVVKFGRSGLWAGASGSGYLYGIWGGFVPKGLAGFVLEGGADLFDVGAVGADGFVALVSCDAKFLGPVGDVGCHFGIDSGYCCRLTELYCLVNRIGLDFVHSPHSSSKEFCDYSTICCLHVCMSPVFFRIFSSSNKASSNKACLHCLSPTSAINCCTGRTCDSWQHSNSKRRSSSHTTGCQCSGSFSQVQAA
jgi:hypothetical protein